jgi:preprotein translocase subunit SecG
MNSEFVWRSRTVLFPLGALSQYIFGSLLFLLSFFIVAIILLQRGRGGGLTGALGGLGGQSAFGVKAGDLFTRITAVLVLLWIFTCAAAARFYKEKGLDIQADTSASSMGGSGASGGLGSPEGLGGVVPGLDALNLPTNPAPSAPATATPSVPAVVPPAANDTPSATDTPVAPSAEPAAAPAAPAAEPAAAPAAEPATPPATEPKSPE